MINTSTTAGKIEVMQAFEDGTSVEGRRKNKNNNPWDDATTPCWDWTYFEFRIKPQTVEEAAVLFYQLGSNNYGEGTVDSFKAGVKWQKEQTDE